MVDKSSLSSSTSRVLELSCDTCFVTLVQIVITRYIVFVLHVAAYFEDEKEWKSLEFELF